MPEFAECFLVELPSVRMFVECFFSKALGKQRVCRVSESLLSVFSLALSEEIICRVSDKIHSVKHMTLGKSFDSGSEGGRASWSRTDGWRCGASVRAYKLVVKVRQINPQTCNCWINLSGLL